MEVFLILGANFGGVWVGALVAKKMREAKKKSNYFKRNAWAIARGEIKSAY